MGLRGKPLSPAGILILDRPTRSAVGIPAQLSWFLLPLISVQLSFSCPLTVWFDLATDLLKLNIAMTDTSYSLDTRVECVRMKSAVITPQASGYETYGMCCSVPFGLPFPRNRDVVCLAMRGRGVQCPQ